MTQKLIYLNAWSFGSGNIWEGLRSVTLLEYVSLEVCFELQNLKRGWVSLPAAYSSRYKILSNHVWLNADMFPTMRIMD